MALWQLMHLALDVQLHVVDTNEPKENSVS